jgi:hypothetical protein
LARAARSIQQSTTREVTVEEAKSMQEPDEERIPALQHILDNPFLLLFLGVALPTVLYIVWGVMEIVAIPISPLAR